MTALRPIKALELVGLTPAQLTDDRPELIWVAPTSLMVDGTYQRNLSERSIKLIRKLVETFAWNRVKPPVVVRHDAQSLHIIDGQHTAIAAATLGIPALPVFVVRADDVVERARAFVGHNSDRVAVSPLDIYQALLAAGDPDALDVHNVCKRAGVRIRIISPSSAIAEGDCASVGLIRALVKRRGVLKARQILECLVKAKRAPIGAAEILAVENIVCNERPSVDLQELTAVIRLDGSAGLAKAHAKAKAERTPVWRAVMGRWLRRLETAA